jgi:putative endopeptidase
VLRYGSAMPTTTTFCARFRRVAPFAAALALLAPRLLPAQGSVTPVSIQERRADPAIRPGDDFYAYANGQWLKATTIPAGKERWGARDEVGIHTRERVTQLIDAGRTAPVGSLPRKVADYRAAWLDERAIEAKGITPLRPQLDSIAQLHDRTALARLLGRWTRADVDPLNWGVYQSSHPLGLAVQASIHGEKEYVAFLVQGGLGLGDREAYLSTDPAMKSLRAEYERYIERMLSLAGFDRAAQRASAVMALESALAARQATREASALDRNADTVWSRADLARRAPGLDWSVYLDAAGLGRTDAVGAWQPGALTGLAELVASQPLEVWQDYLRLHLLDEQADLLPRAYSEAALALHAVVSGQQPAVRADRALAATQAGMSDAIGRMYSEACFPAADKARVRRIVANVTAAFEHRVERVTWMSAATRMRALAKLKVLYVGIGYPEQWPPMSDLRIDAADPIGNQRRVADWNYARTLARLGQPVDRAEWLVAPQTPGALLNFQQNLYDFSAALLQSPKYDAKASDAAAYGAIGAIIGHDISHFIDMLGADYDVNGAMRHWWTADDQSRFDALTAPLVQQVSAYKPFADLAVDGKHSLTENVADLAGLVAAFDAYRLSLGARISDKTALRRSDREFFLAFAQAWPAKFTDAGMRKQAVGDHAPETYRYLTVRNLDAWYEAFGVGPGDRLYLAPAARVRIW